MMKKAKRAGGFSADISHGNVEAILKPVALPRNRLNRPWHEVRVGAAGGYWPIPTLKCRTKVSETKGWGAPVEPK